MGLLVGFLKFAVKHLAWPLLALVYPLCASLRAIEANSVPETRKLNTYWVIFSLILLLEHALAKLLEWFPLWPYIRLIIVCVLVIPDFDGAFYVYKYFICPCLGLEPKIIINLFSKLKETSTERERLLVEVEKYVRENGTRDLEKIIACKSVFTKNLEVKEIKAISSVDNNKAANQPTSNGPDVTRKDIKAGEVSEKNEVIKAMQVNQVERKLAEATEKRTVLSTETKQTVSEVTAGRELPQTLTPKIVRKEWNCIKCCLTLQSEATYNAHLQGKKHKAMVEATNAKSQIFPPKIVPSHVPKKPDQPAEEPGNSMKNQTVFFPKLFFLNTEKKFDHPTDEPGKNSVLSSEKKPIVILPKSSQGNRNIKILVSPGAKKSDHEHKEEPKKSVSKSEMKGQSSIKFEGKKVQNRGNVGVKDFSLWCRVCNVKCTGKIDLESHLRGRKHLTQVQFSSA